MAMRVGTLSDEEMGWFIRGRDRERDGTGFGTLATERGNLPLESLDVRGVITGLSARTELSQGFHNPYDTPLEATYIFPLPDRAAVTALRMEAADRVVDGELKERGQARADYDAAISAGRRASIAEQERADVFTMRVGNILPGERVTVRLTLDGPLPYDSGQATYRFPLVVAPRYVPGRPLDDAPVGDGTALDTDATPDASRITPPVLLPGFPNPVRLSIQVEVDPAGLPLTGARSSLHAARTEDLPDGRGRLIVDPGERADRDFVLRLDYGDRAAVATALTLVPDPSGAAEGDGTFRLTVLPPAVAAPSRPRDVVLLLDRSGSMSGWKMVAARRAAARIVDTLTSADRFAVLLFDHVVERPEGLPAGLVEATDRNRFRAVEELANTPARGGTELLAPLTEAAALLTGAEADQPARDRVLVLVTDGQVGNEDQIVAGVAGPLGRVRVHAVGIDRAVNAGFLGRLASLGGGRCELVESEDRLDDAMTRIHRRIGTPVVTAPRLTVPPDSTLRLLADTVTPARLPDLFEGAPLVVAGRYHGTGTTVTVTGTTPDAEPWTTTITATPAEPPKQAAGSRPPEQITVSDSPEQAAGSDPLARVAGTDPVAVGWARAYLRDLEDRYAAGRADPELERRMVGVSLGYGVLCRFTAFVAVDSRVVTDGGTPHRVTQPVEQPSGWEIPTPPQAQAPSPAGGYGAGGIVPMALSFSTRSRTAFGSPPAPAPGAPAGPPPDDEAAALRRRAPRSRAGVPPAPAGAPWVPGRPAVPGRPDPLAAARTQIGEELRRLREFDAPSGSSARRLVVLADLGSRLGVLADHLAGHGVPAGAGGPVAVLRELVERLLACDGDNPPRGAELDRLWQDTVDTLSRFAAGEGTGGPAAGPGGADAGGRGDGSGGRVKRDRRSFWKKS